MSSFKVSIDGKELVAYSGETVLKVAKRNNIMIPSLCYHEDLCIAGNCRVCVVDVEGSPYLEASCALPVYEGMVVHTSTPKVRNARREIISLLVSEHKTECTTCYRNTNCELQNLASQYNIDNETFRPIVDEKREIDRSSSAIEKNDKKCVRCKRCVRACEGLQMVNAIDSSWRGDRMKITTMDDIPLNDAICVNCGQCVVHCPTAALTERRYFSEVWEAISDPEKFVIINTAPSVRATLGEMFDYPPGTPVTGKMVAALKEIGFDAVLDTNFAADLTIVEEGYELLERLTKQFKEGEPQKLPMITSCSPGWVKFIEHMYPEHLGHLSTAKSPQQMFGAVAKTYYAKKMNINPKDMVVVAGMPCSAKKYEAKRPEMRASGFIDVDYGLTTREIGQMIKQTSINFQELEDGTFDSLMGFSTGAGDLFGASGGVMEAALRTVYEVVTGRELPFENLEMKSVRGLDSIKEASVLFENVTSEFSFLEGITVNVAVTHGLFNAKALMDNLVKGKSDYHFIEIMACPGGCIGGGGSPYPVNESIRKKRMNALYLEDIGKKIRKSHLNPEVQELYKNFLDHPLSEEAHRILHTHYVKRTKY